MTSSYFSRLLPGSSASHSIYRTLDDQDEEAGAEGGSPEAARRIGYDPAEDFLEQELADARSQQDGISPLPSTAPSAAESPEITAKTLGKGKEVEKYPALDRRNSESTASNATFPRGTSRPRWMTRSPRLAGEGEELDDVPHSLLLDDADTISQAGALHPADPRPYTDDPESAMHSPGRVPPARPLIASPPRKPAPIRPLRPPDRPVGRDYIADQLNGLSPRDRALWYWINVENLDLFLHDIYNYFLGKGIWSIMLGRAIGLMTVAFVVGLSLFLTMCVDYSAIPTSKNLNQVIIPKCTNKMSLLSNLVIWVFTFVWFAKAFSYVVDYRRLRVIQDFYVHLLEIPQADMQTVSWQDIVGRVMLIKDIHPQSRTVPPNARTFMGNHSKQKLDAHDIANRLMRKENYLIAMFNRDLLKLTLPIPFLGERTFFSKTLEWNINYCILDFAFNEQGHLRPIFLRSNSRKALSESLATRFRFAAVFSIVSAPFLLGYNLVTTFFRYFQEVRNSASAVTSRQYSPLAEWKFREFNELWHMFQRRLKMSYPSANLYINQFPKDKTSQTANFVAFLAGAVGAVLATISLLDQESFLSFEITQGRTALFYITISGTVFLVAKGLIPGENEVFAPDYYLGLVLEWLHYMPSEWQNDLHSTRVRDQFAQLFRMKATIFLDEILGLITAPFLLWFVLPRCSDRIVDFFREYTVHVDGLGYVCSSAVFDFQRGPDLATKLRDQMPLTDEAAHDRKMMASYQGFLDQYAAYQPGPHVRAFHPPGHPPSMASPPHLPQIRPPAKQGGQPRNRGSVAPRSRAPLGRSTYSLGRSTKFADGSVGRSMLFDPRNQPTALSPPSHLRQAQRLPRLSPGRRRSEDIAEELNERSNAPSPSPSPRPQPQPPAQVLAVPAVEEHEEDEMSLEGSFVTTRAADNVGDSPGYKASTAALDPDNDVIGLLYQFQKGQTDVRG